MSYCAYKQDFDTFDTYVFADGICLHFDVHSKCTGNCSKLPDGSFRSVDLLSVLLHPCGVEIGCNIDGEFRKFPSHLSGSDAIARINTLKIVYTGNRELQIKDINAIQIIYVFRKGYLNFEGVQKGLK